MRSPGSSCATSAPTSARSCGSGPGLTVVAGRNGAGKTNLLEALYFACTGRSCRTANEREVVRFGAQLTRLELEAADERGRARGDGRLPARRGEAPARRRRGRGAAHRRRGAAAGLGVPARPARARARARRRCGARTSTRSSPRCGRRERDPARVRRRARPAQRADRRHPRRPRRPRLAAGLGRGARPARRSS